LIIVGIIVIGLILLIVFRRRVFSPHVSLVEPAIQIGDPQNAIERRAVIQQALVDGVGYYDEPNVGECMPVNPGQSLCHQPGVRTVVRRCIPNSVTSRGCVTSQGMTYDMKVEEETCVPLCRASIWSSVVSSGCTRPPLPPEGCYTSNTGTLTRSQTCVPNDAFGTNTCTYRRSFNSTEPIPTGCSLDQIGTVVTCSVGTTLITEEQCLADFGDEQNCGVWRVDSTQPCSFSDAPLRSQACQRPGGGLFTDDVDILKPGWVPQGMSCVKASDSTQSTSICPPVPDCVESSQAYSALTAAQTTLQPVVLCGHPPGCIRKCLFYPDVDSTHTGLRSIIGTFQIITLVNEGNVYSLGLNNVPCPSLGGNFIRGASLRNTAPLGDCFGDPLKPLEDTPSLLINMSTIAASPQTHHLSSDCKLGIDQAVVPSKSIVQMSSLYVTFRPTRNIVDPNVLYCNIFAILGQRYLGVLTVNSSNLAWTHSNFDTSSGAEFKVSFLSDNTYSIRLADDTPVTSVTTDKQTLNLDNVQLIMRVTDFNALHEILRDRQTRLNPQSCNAMYSYPPPRTYPRPDVV
jgi:hypothetical protein